MNTLEMEAENSCPVGSETVIHLPSGLLGFESIKRFLLTCAGRRSIPLVAGGEGPLSLSFLVISPFEVTPEYAPDIPNEDVRSLGINAPTMCFC